MCVCVRGSGVCHNVPVSEIIAVREEEEETRDDGSWKKIKEREGKDCRQAFTGTDRGNICRVGEFNSTILAARFKVVSVSAFIRRADSPPRPSFLKTMIMFQQNAASTHIQFECVPSTVLYVERCQRHRWRCAEVTFACPDEALCQLWISSIREQLTATSTT